jgi:cobalt/nickel transport system ATP-binding protein
MATTVMSTTSPRPAAAPPPTLAVDGVSVRLDGRTVLEDVRFDVRVGERVVIVGVNGCGKTTLLRLLDALAFPDAGEVRYAGRALAPAALDEPAFKLRFRSEVALLFQNVDAMLFNPTVADEIAFGPRQLGLADVAGRVARWAETFDVTALLARAPFELSGGEKKRVALAALLAVEPRVLLLDEGTAHLDPASVGRLVDVLAGIPGLTVVATTHNLSMATELGDRAILLAPGKRGALFDGDAHDLLRDERLLAESGLAHRHAHRHGGQVHAHYHVHDAE